MALLLAKRGIRNDHASNIKTGRLAMLTRRLFASCAICAASGLMATGVAAGAEAPASPGNVTRTLIQRTEGPADGYVTILMRIDIGPGVTVPWHTHPGIESAYFLQGAATLSIKGQPDRQIKGGDGSEIPPYTPHKVQNGDTTLQLVATYVVEKDKPLLTPAPQ
jgi:quercetin dioxygenase-like cupin family protein